MARKAGKAFALGTSFTYGFEMLGAHERLVQTPLTTAAYTTLTAALAAHPNVEIRREAIDELPPESWGSTIVATGPLTAPGLAEAIRGLTGAESLAFFDAIAPIVHRDSIDMDKAWFASRWDKGEADYINCPMTKEQYRAFHQALLDDPEFRAGDYTIKWLEEWLAKQG